MIFKTKFLLLLKSNLTPSQGWNSALLGNCPCFIVASCSLALPWHSGQLRRVRKVARECSPQSRVRGCRQRCTSRSHWWRPCRGGGCCRPAGPRPGGSTCTTQVSSPQILVCVGLIYRRGRRLQIRWVFTLRRWRHFRSYSCLSSYYCGVSTADTWPS